MELSLGSERSRATSASRRTQRQSRARWWFERMRRAVEEACDWPPAPLPRAEQTWFEAAVGAAEAQVEKSLEERQICE